MYESDSSSSVKSNGSSFSRMRRVGYMNEPVQLTRIDQITRRSNYSSFAYKEDAIHRHILDLLYNDAITDVSDPMRRGLANNLHFLIMRDMFDAVDAQRIVPECIDLLYEYDKLKKLHRTKLVIIDVAGIEAKGEAGLVSLEGGWVESRFQALDSLRRAAEAAIYGK